MADANMAALFGDSDDDDDFQPSERPQAQPAGRQADGAQAAQPRDDDDDDDDFRDVPAPRQPEQLRQYSDEDEEEAIVREVAEERPQGPPQEMSGALLPVPPINKLRLLQTSRFLALQPLPMTPENLLKEREPGEIDEETGEVRHSYRKQMTIRWRERTLPSGETRVESNARFVRWSDGSMQLLLGDEVLDMVELDNTSAHQYMFVRHTHPVAFIQGQGQLTRKLQLRPASLSSKFHRQLTEAAARRHVKVNKVKATATVADPNRAKAEREKVEEERIRSRETLARRQEREMRKYPAAARREYRPTGITTQFLETIEDEPDYSDGEEDLTATERARSALQRRRQLDDEEERAAEERLARAKQDTAAAAAKRPREEPAPRASPPRVASAGAFLDESDEEDVVARPSAKKKGRRGGLVFSDDEDE